MTRPIAFDVTHLASRLPVAAPSGIDKVDLAYARHFSGTACSAAIHYGLRRPRVLAPSAIDEILATATSGRWAGTPLDDDPAFTRVKAWLAHGEQPAGSAGGTRPHGQADGWHRKLAQLRWRLTDHRRVLPQGSIYLNVAQHAFEYAGFFSWLEGRPDIAPVFMLHDLLPLDYPEYFRPGYRARFQHRVETFVRHAKAVITTSAAVAERAGIALAGRQRGVPIPIHVEPLPSSLPREALTAGVDPQLTATPYFIALGTIEPRKNHLLLLNVWRQLAMEHHTPPKLIIIGTRGWENEQVLDVLDRGRLTRPHVLEISGVSDAALVRLLANARALLASSFAEGYGLPLVEALSLGVPVIASDIPVFREITRGCALYRHPLDGPGWRRLIEELSSPEHDSAREARATAARFKPPTWPGYFAGIDSFLASL